MQTHLTIKGLVIQETPHGDADKIIDLFTENGIRTVYAKSVRKPGSKYAAVTQLFSYGEFCLRCRGEKLYLDSAVSLDLFFGIRNDLDSLALASYFAELARKTATSQKQPQILRLFLLSLHHLSERSRPLLLIKAIFELRFMTEIGMMPNLICCESCMEYMPEHPVLRIRFPWLNCRECIEIRDNLDMQVTQAVLLAARHVVFTDFDRLFQFRIKGKSAELFMAYTEKYLQHRLGMRIRTLEFFNEIQHWNDEDDDMW